MYNKGTNAHDLLEVGRMIKEYLEVPKIAEYDVLVAGGGVAGVAAALTASRAGCKTLLMEKSILLGGLATNGLINYIEPLCDGRGRKIIGGVCEELLRFSIKYGYDTVPGPWKDAAEGKRENINPELLTDSNRQNPPRYVTRFSPYIFAMSLTGFLKEHGTDLLFDTLACKPVMDQGACQGVIVENKSGRQYYKAKIVIDATGDSDLLYRAGVPTETTGNWFSFWGRVMDMESMEAALGDRKIEKGVRPFNIGSNLYGKGHPEGMKKLDGTDVRDITEYVIEGHRRTVELIQNDNRFERDIVMLPFMPQFRTTRRIIGDYELTEQDQYKHFDDSIGAICDFTKRDIVYEVPYRCLYNSKFSNLLTAGRSVSAAGWAWDVTRVIPPAILTGQAAGQAAAMAVKMSKDLTEIPIEQLQQALADTGVMIHF
ncbi:MAG: FAD-dependent oxidoreductase [Clostridiaceae bacterium]|jgi:hypothetical protein|nr:FAD-dependent oxidoreductase [Clostridiaceae bacterium]